MKNLKGQMNLFDVPVVDGTSARKVAVDFGEHIGGARKEEWADSGLSIENILKMNEAEREKFVKKDQIWKKPDYNKMIQDGVPVTVAYAIKKCRDGLPAKPSFSYRDTKDNVLEKQKNFISFVSVVRDGISSVRTVEEFLAAQEKVKKQIIDDSSATRYYVVPLPQYSGLLNNKLLHALLCKESTFRMTYASEVKQTQFGVAKEQKIPAGWDIYFYDGKGYSRSDNLKVNTYYITKGYRIIAENIDSYEEALKLCQDCAKKISGNRKKTFTPPQLSRVERTGLEDIRNGVDVIGDDFIRDFSIRGGEFGNWMSEKDAQASLNMAYDAFCDFADILGISRSEVSFGGRLAIAFGARGKGSAVAHYEPLREVINITKMKGAGSLGHELFHALDDIVGKKLGLSKMMTESSSRDIPESVRNVIHVMKYRSATLEEKEATKAGNIAWTEKRLRRSLDAHFPILSDMSEEQKAVRARLIEAIIADEGANLKDDTSLLMCTGTDAITAFSNYKKQICDRVIPSSGRSEICSLWISLIIEKRRDCSKEQQVYSNFFLNSKKMDNCMAKDKFGYWSSPCEMFARAGACYLSDMIAERGGRSDYLSGHSECCIGADVSDNGEIQFIRAMPQGEERKRINQAISKMIDDLKQKNLL